MIPHRLGTHEVLCGVGFAPSGEPSLRRTTQTAGRQCAGGDLSGLPAGINSSISSKRNIALPGMVGGVSPGSWGQPSNSFRAVASPGIPSTNVDELA